MWINTLLNQAGHHALRRRINACAETLQGCRSVALWFQDSRKFTAALFAAWQAGAEVWLIPGPKAQHWAQQADVWLSDCLPERPSENRNHRLFDHLPEPDKRHDTPLHLPEHARLLLQTSGSGGEAKTVVKTCAQMCCEAETVAAILPQEWQNLPVYAGVSPQHLYGLTFRIFVALKMAWQDRGNCTYPEEFTAAAQTPCVWLTSPTVLNRFDGPRNWPQLQQNVKGIISAGGMLPPQTQALFEAHGLSIFDVYGSSETGVTAWRSGGKTHTLFPNVAARCDEDKRLHILSPWSSGEQALADTADVEGSRLVLHGRADRIVKLADKRISLHTPEHLLLAHEYIADAHCTLHRGRIAVWAALNEAGIRYLCEHGRTALTALLRQTLADALEKTALPRYWRFAAHTLPRNAQAKIRAADVEAVLAALPHSPDWQQTAHQDNEWHFTGTVPLDLRYFNGHFARFPLVPGVVQIQWVMSLAAQFDWATAPVIQVENLKYQHFIRPNDEVSLQLRWDADKRKIYFSLSVSERKCASGRLVLG
ncbi:AMP-binding protein [Neisseria lisongii]|uniref:AMP-binding protein n=1 Tax=Neisseria lisongii TaxID=2912188 RepID=A0AAW5AJC4_9NEIS|nr:AMP-binding protein [Neisseria lisongii]MCF7529249.1 AMP-binding protein [Neisseria lisongii]